MTRDWRNAQPRRLGEILHVRHGFAFKGEYFSDEGKYIVLTPGNFYDKGGFKRKRGAEKYYEGPIPDGFILEAGDVVIAMTEQVRGLLGSSAIIPISDTYLHNQRIGLVELLSPTEADRRYIYYLLNTPATRDQIQATATGSKVRHTAPARIEAMEVALPPLLVQQQIVAVLSSIDALIENNRRRIEIFEEMARLIYREWFVHFRFPGHEDVELVDSDLGPIPEGWKVGHLSELVELAYGKALKADDRRGGDVAVYGSGGMVGWHDESLVEGPGIVVGRKGNVGAVYWSDVDFYPIDTTYFVKTHLPLSYVYHQLHTVEFIDSHAAVPGLSRDQAYGLKVVMPTDEVLAKFDELVAPMYDLRCNLLAQNDALSRSRNLLLPRLISGELDVSDLDLDLEPVA